MMESIDANMAFFFSHSKLRPKWIPEIEKERWNLLQVLSVTYGGQLGILSNIGSWLQTFI